MGIGAPTTGLLKQAHMGHGSPHGHLLPRANSPAGPHTPLATPETLPPSQPLLLPPRETSGPGRPAGRRGARGGAGAPCAPAELVIEVASHSVCGIEEENDDHHPAGREPKECAAAAHDESRHGVVIGVPSDWYSPRQEHVMQAACKRTMVNFRNCVALLSTPHHEWWTHMKGV